MLPICYRAMKIPTLLAEATMGLFDTLKIRIVFSWLTRGWERMASIYRRCRILPREKKYV